MQISREYRAMRMCVIRTEYREHTFEIPDNATKQEEDDIINGYDWDESSCYDSDETREEEATEG